MHFKMSLNIHSKKDMLLSNGTPFTLFLLNCLASPRKEETLFNPFVLSLLYKVFIYLGESNSCRLMADMTLLIITGWAMLCILRNVIYDKDYKENNLSRFPYQDGTVNQWFPENALSEDHTSGTINMLNLLKRPNLNKSEEYPRLNEAVFPPSGEEVESFTMLYHGTMHVHAKEILKGVKLTESTEDGDFSCGKGFYLTNQFERAAHYAFSKSAKAAVLVFKIRNEDLEGFRTRSLDLVGEENKQKWEEVVKDIRKFVKKYCFIEGPEIKRKRGAVKTSHQLPDTHQMCILDEEMAETFDRHLHSVVFYNTSSQERRTKSGSKSKR